MGVNQVKPDPTETTELPPTMPPPTMKDPMAKDGTLGHMVHAETIEEAPLVHAVQVNFVCCLYGYKTVIPLAFGFLGAMFSAATIFTCFVVSTYEAPDSHGILWGYNCLRFVPCSACGDEDLPFEYGRIASFISAIGGFVYTGLATGLLSCRAVSNKISALLALGFVAFGSLSLSVLVAQTTDQCTHWTDNDCQAGPGTTMAIVAGVMYLAAGIATLALVLGRSQRRI